MNYIELTLSELLQAETIKNPNKEFVIYPDRKIRYTYGEFNNRVDSLAKGLMEIGIGKGDHVGIWATNVTDWITLMFSTAKIGAILVTINTNYKLSELEYLVKQADLKALCIIEGFKDSDYIEMIYELVPELKEQERGKLKSELFPLLENVIFIGDQHHRGMYNIPEILEMGKGKDPIHIHLNCHEVINMHYLWNHRFSKGSYVKPL